MELSEYKMIIYENVIKDIHDYLGTRRAISTSLRMNVWEMVYNELSGKCILCDKEIHLNDGQSWEVSHILPNSRGGDEILENLRPLCKGCNRNMTTETIQEYCLRLYPLRIKDISEKLKVKFE